MHKMLFFSLLIAMLAALAIAAESGTDAPDNGMDEPPAPFTAAPDAAPFPPPSRTPDEQRELPPFAGFTPAAVPGDDAPGAFPFPPPARMTNGQQELPSFAGFTPAAMSEDPGPDKPADAVAGEMHPDDVLVGLKYENMELDEVLKQYSEWTGRAIMKAPEVPSVQITLKCPRRIPRREALMAIEGILGMYGIALVPMGENFLRVVPIGTARQSGMITGMGTLPPEIEDTGHLVSRIVELKHIETGEAQNILKDLVSPHGKIMPLERINCLLITDAALNIKRIFEILEMLDLPMGSREELRIFPIINAKASEVQARIESIIADSQAEDDRVSLLRRQLRASRMPLRPQQPAPGFQPQPPAPETSPAPERGLVQGKVKIVSDDRTNSLIIIARPDQFNFFENLIDALDKQVDPAVTIKVMRLEYADAEKVVAVLNNLVGTASQDTQRTGRPDRAAGREPFSLPEAVAAARGEPAPATGGEVTIEGRLSSDVKIIADPRINALLVMASRSDMAIIEDVLTRVDIMLSQVLIEVVIIEVGLDDKTRMGVDWLQRSMIAYNRDQSGGRRAFMGFAGTSREATAGNIRNASLINTVADNTAAAGSGLTYYLTLFDFNVDAVLNMLATTSEARILSTPIILTTDNTEAKILVGEKRPIVTSTSMSAGGVQQSTYQYTNIGIELNVTPRINKRGFVVMDIKQKIDNTGGEVQIDQNRVPIITTREFNASIAIDDGQTIVLGGLVSSEEGKGRTKVPFLGDIPLLGMLFRSDATDALKRELLVMITPYVLDTPEKVYSETVRRQDAIDASTNIWAQGWSAGESTEPDANTARQ